MKFEPVLRFIACSDVHYKVESPVEPERFERGMSLAYEYAERQDYKNIDAVYVVGDFATNGTREQMELFKSSLDKVIRPGTEVTLTVASHEYKCPDVENMIDRFCALFCQATDNHKVINGFHFISISTDERNRTSDSQIEWLKEQLRSAADEDHKKPIFVFQHPHLSDTVYGSINWGEDDIITALMDYPQVVDFSGHSHAPVNDPRSVHQKYFSSFGTGSFSYFELDEFDFMYGTVPPDAKQCAQYLIVEVDKDNRVRVLPFDILSEKFFNDGWLIERPWDPSSFVYTADRALSATKPIFKDNARFDASYSGGKAKFVFEQAVHPERPDSYTIVIKSVPGGRIFAQKTVPSSYYIYDMPDILTVEFDICLPAGEYVAELTANGFWNNHSEKLCKALRSDGYNND